MVVIAIHECMLYINVRHSFMGNCEIWSAKLSRNMSQNYHNFRNVSKNFLLVELLNGLNWVPWEEIFNWKLLKEETHRSMLIFITHFRPEANFICCIRVSNFQINFEIKLKITSRKKLLQQQHHENCMLCAWTVLCHTQKSSLPKMGKRRMMKFMSLLVCKIHFSRFFIQFWVSKKA